MINNEIKNDRNEKNENVIYNIYFTFQPRYSGFKNKLVKIAASSESSAKHVMHYHYGEIWQDYFLDGDIDLSKYEIIDEYNAEISASRYSESECKTFIFDYRMHYRADTLDSYVDAYAGESAEDALKPFLVDYKKYEGCDFMNCYPNKVEIIEVADVEIAYHLNEVSELDDNGELTETINEITYNDSSKSSHTQ